MPSGFATVTNGAELTEEEVAALLVEPLLARATVLASAPTIFDSAGVPLRIPKIAALNLTDPWRQENTLIAEADPTYSEVVLLPSTLKSLKVIHRVSNELVRHAVVAVSAVLSGALVTRVALALDAAFLTGTGTGGTITGLANCTGIQVMAAVGTPTVDALHDAEGLLLAANATPESSVWFMAPTVFTKLRKQRTTQGAYLLMPDPTAAGGYVLLGHRVMLSTQMPSTYALLVDMAQVAIGRDQDVNVAILTERFADFDQVGIRVTARFDIAPLNAAAVVKMDGLT